MPKVTFLPANQTFDFESGKLPYSDHGQPESVLDVALNLGFHLEHACGGSCACTTCHVVVKSGDANLSPMDEDEADPSLWWVIISTGSIIILTLSYVGWRKYQGEKEIRKPRTRVHKD